MVVTVTTEVDGSRKRCQRALRDDVGVTMIASDFFGLSLAEKLRRVDYPGLWQSQSSFVFIFSSANGRETERPN